MQFAGYIWWLLLGISHNFLFAGIGWKLSKIAIIIWWNLMYFCEFTGFWWNGLFNVVESDRFFGFPPKCWIFMKLCSYIWILLDFTRFVCSVLYICWISVDMCWILMDLVGTFQEMVEVDGNNGGNWFSSIFHQYPANFD